MADRSRSMDRAADADDTRRPRSRASSGNGRDLAADAVRPDVGGGSASGTASDRHAATHAPRDPVQIRMLGRFEAHRADGAPIGGLGRRGVALLACLAVSEEPWTRPGVAELLWPGRGPENAQASFRQELLRLRRALGWDAGADGAPGGPLRIPDGTAEIDVARFRRAAADPHGAAEAVELYRGDLLQGFPVAGLEAFADWLGRQRERLRAAAMDRMLGLLRSPAGGEALARRIVHLDPACEEAHRHLIRLLAGRGDLGRVLAQFRACADALQSASGTGPSAETTALLDAVTVELGVRPAHRPPPGRAGAAEIDWIRRAADAAPVPAAPEPRMLPVVADKPSVAVLAFADLSPDPLGGDVLAEGMTEEVTNALARVPGFFVTARHSAFAYRGAALDVRRIAAELGVRYVVEGSVERDGRGLRTNVRLIDGRTGLHLWAETEAGPPGGAMAVRDAVVQRIAARLQPRLLLEEMRQAMRRPPQDLDAWSWLQRAAGVLLLGRHKAALEHALDPLQRSLEADPQYAMANALLSAVYTWRAVTQSFPDPQGEKRLAREHAELALAADPENPFVLTHCAETAIYSSADIDRALAMLELAVRRDPNDANGLATLAHTRRFAGEDPRASLALIGQAIRLSPRDPRTFAWHHYANWCHFRLGDLEAMEACCRRSIELYGQHPLSWIALTSALGLRGRIPEAREAASVLRRLRPGFSPDGFYETARFFYGGRFEGEVRREYGDLRSALSRAWE